MMTAVAVPTSIQSGVPLAELRVMLIDESQERSAALADLLQSVECDVIASLSPEEDLLSQVARHRPDVVIIDIDLPSRDTLESLRSVQASDPRPMVMFSQDDNGETIRRAVQAGVSAYVVDGVQAHRVRPILEVAIVRFDEHRRLQAELDRTRSELEGRKKIERAKGIVMMQRGISEPAAYRLMRTAAMDQNRRLVEIADSIIAAAELLGGREVGS
jgi:response regulator NasT